MRDRTPRHSVSVAAAVVNDLGQVLAIRRRDNGRWEPPGGVLEVNEPVEAGLRREVSEETGLDIEVERLTGVYKNVPRGVVALVFRCKPAGGEVSITDETTDARWLTPAEVQDCMTEAYSIRLLDALQDHEVAVRDHDGSSLLVLDARTAPVSEYVRAGALALTSTRRIRPSQEKGVDEKMSRIRWEDYERSPLYEDMGAVLLSRLYPNSERIDGIGGDGGRDVQLRTPGELHLFELKSFTGRLSARSPNRRRQIEQSLERAAELRPTSWTLIVPINHNEAELSWFDGLRQRYPFPLVWLGRTWLDDQMGKHSDIRSYYLDDARDEVVELLRELNVEQAALGGGAAQGIERFNTLRNRLNEIDPQYSFELTPGPAEAAAIAFPTAVMHTERRDEKGAVTISILAKYPLAVRDRPIMVKVQAQFPRTEMGEEAAQRFRDFLEFGDPAVLAPEHIASLQVDAPGGLGGTLHSGTLRVGPAKNETPLVVDTRLRVLDRNNKHLASIPIRFTDRHGGQRGFVSLGHDNIKMLHLRLRLDDLTNRVDFTLQLRPVEGQLPASLLPSLRAVRALRAGNKIVLSVDGKDLWEPQTLNDDIELISAEYVELVENLARIQAETSTPFEMPAEVDAEEVATVHRLARLLDGEALSVTAVPMTVTLDAEAPRPWQETGQHGVTAFEADHYATLMGQTVPLGVCNIIAGPWSVDEEAVSEAPTSSVVTFTPDPDVQAFLRRGALPRDNASGDPDASESPAESMLPN